MEALFVLVVIGLLGWWAWKGFPLPGGNKSGLD